MTLLAGCQGVAEPGSESAEQALGTFCNMQMPQIVEWNGSKIEPSGPNSMFVVFRYTDKSKLAVTSEEEEKIMVAEADQDSGEVLQAQTTSTTSEKIEELAPYLLRLESVRIPGTPPEPCVSQPFACGAWIASVAVFTNKATLDATAAYESCPLK
jgi:hypothetical protein